MNLLRFLIVSAILLISINVSNPLSYAGDEIVFSDIDRVAVDLQKYSILTEKLKVLETQLVHFELTAYNYEQHNNLIEEQNKLLIERFKLVESYSNQQQRFIDNTSTLLTKQKELCDLAIKEAQPSILNKIKDSLSFVGIGIVIGILLL